MHFKNPANTKTASGRVGWCICTICSNQQCLKSIPVPCSNWQQRIRNRWKVRLNLVNFYTSFVIYSKSALYKIHIAFKEQIRNKTVFFYNSVFFSFHLISFFALGNIWVSQQVDFWLKYPLAKSSDFPNI